MLNLCQHPKTYFQLYTATFNRMADSKFGYLRLDLRFKLAEKLFLTIRGLFLSLFTIENIRYMNFRFYSRCI